MTQIPYEFTAEFRQAKEELKDRFFPVLHASLGKGQSDLSKEDAACGYMQKMAELHEKFLFVASLSEQQRRNRLKIAICEAEEEVRALVPGRYEALIQYRNFLIQTKAQGPTSVPAEDSPMPNQDDRAGLALESASERPRLLTEIVAALDVDDKTNRDKAFRLRCELEDRSVKELCLAIFAERRGSDSTKRTACNRWRAKRKSTPKWADGPIRARLLEPSEITS